jgi:thioredoxin-related protein
MKRIIVAMLAVMFGAVAADGATLGDDGLHKEDWFAITFRDIADDIEAAREQGKKLVMVFEQRGCIYCREVHEEILVDPEVRAFLEKNFMIVQYNLYGDEEVTDLDGSILAEKTAARSWGVLFTPTFLFMPETPPDGKNAREAAVAVMPGAFKKGTFLDMFTWVSLNGYDTEEGFQAYHSRRIRERAAAGEENTD